MPHDIDSTEVRRRVRLLSTRQLLLVAHGTANVVPVAAPLAAIQRFETVREEVQRELQRRGVPLDTGQAPHGIAIYRGPSSATPKRRYQA